MAVVSETPAVILTKERKSVQIIATLTRAFYFVMTVRFGSAGVTWFQLVIVFLCLHVA